MNRYPLVFLVPLLAILFIYVACTPPIQSRFLTADEMGMRPSDFEENTRNRRPRRGPCYTPVNFAPDTNYMDHSPMKYLRINIHWMNSADGTQNLSEEEALEYTTGLLHAVNYALENNKPMWLPHGNDTPTLPINFRYKLTGRPGDPDDDGIYFHYDDSLYYYIHQGHRESNLYKREVFEKYGVQLDTVLNVFLMPHHPDSVASPTYSAGDVGVALRNAVKVAGQWKEAYAADKRSYWRFRGVFNHEVGHILSLSHTWAYQDGCDDTPRHPQNCWSRSQEPRCDTMTSNNVMDYNNQQLAWTPCQIGKVHLRFADARRNGRNFLEPNWCVLDHAFDITIRDTVVWDCMKDLQGNITIAPGGHLTVMCRLSIPPDGKITVQPGGTLVVEGAHLHQACDESWQGIVVEKQEELEGQVVMNGNYLVEDVALRE